MPVVGGFKHALVSDGTGLNFDSSVPREWPPWSKAVIDRHQSNVCFLPKADMVPTLLDNLIGTLLERRGHIEAERLRSLEVDHKLKLSWLQYW